MNRNGVKNLVKCPPVHHRPNERRNILVDTTPYMPCLELYCDVLTTCIYKYRISVSKIEVLKEIDKPVDAKKHNDPTSSVCD
jgi:hypothetical protein